MSEPVRIGLSISSRISAPANTLPTYRGFLLAMETLKTDATLPADIHWEILDDHGDPERSLSLAQEAVADPSYVAIVGPMGSTEAFANAPVFDRAGLLQVSPCASHPDLCQQGYSTFFRLVPNEKVQGTELARIPREYLGAQRASIVHDGDAFGTSVADNFSAGFLEASGATSSPGRASNRDQTNTAPSPTRSPRPSLRWSSLPCTVTKAHSSREKSADRGITAPFLGTDGLKTSFFLGGGMPDAEAYHTHSGADFNRMPSAIDFRDEYVTRFPEDSTYSPEAYDAAMLVAEAIRRAEAPTRDEVLTAFRSIDGFEGITGTIRFSDIGERLDAPVSFYRVELQDDRRVMAYQGVTTDITS